MPRTQNSPASRQRRKKVLQRAKGYRQGRSKLYRRAKEFSEKGLTYAYRDRRTKKRTFRNLWITRIAAGCETNGISYNRFIYGLKKEKIDLDRKTLADIAFHQPGQFSALVAQIKGEKRPDENS